MVQRSDFQKYYSELELDTPEERRARAEAIERAKQHLVHYQQQHANEPLPEIEDDGIFREYIDSEMTKETLDEVIREDYMLRRLRNAPRSFPHALQGYERQKLTQHRNTHAQEKSFGEIATPLHKLPLELQKALLGCEADATKQQQQQKQKKKKGQKQQQTTPTIVGTPRVLNAITELSKFIKKQLSSTGDNSGNSGLVSTIQMELLAQESNIFLHASLGLLPKSNTFLRPIALELSKPLHKRDNVDILVFVADKARKEQLKRYIASESWSSSTKIIQLSKFRKFFQSMDSQHALANSYDLFFADESIEQELYLLGSAFDSAYNRTAPILIRNSNKNYSDSGDSTSSNDDPKQQKELVSMVNRFINGTKIYVSRGLQPITIHVGYAQWNPEDVHANVVKVVQQLARYVEGGMDNVLRLYVSGEKTPSLPFYYNEKAYMQRFTECKQFLTEQRRVKSGEIAATLIEQDDEVNSNNNKDNKKKKNNSRGTKRSKVDADEEEVDYDHEDELRDVYATIESDDDDNDNEVVEPVPRAAPNKKQRQTPAPAPAPQQQQQSKSTRGEGGNTFVAKKRRLTKK